MEGRGRLTMVDGSIYEGEFANDAFNGRGRNVLANGDIYEGTSKMDTWRGGQVRR